MNLMIQFGRFRPAAIRSGLLLGLLAGFAPSAAAQTTLNLTAVKDATIRGGTYSTVAHGGDQSLVTRRSDDLQYERRAVLTFDTETTIPSNTTIQSASLVLTVRGGNNEVRQLAAYTVPVSFENDDVTWRQRRAGLLWSNAGGDVTASPAMATASPTPGSQVSFDVTSHVQRVLDGQYGSRYARFLISDAGSASRDSYREYHSLESSTSSSRPRLTVTFGGSEGGGSAPSSAVATPDSNGNIILTPDHVSVRAGRWAVESTSGALSGSALRHPDGGAAKLNAALSSPANYFDMQFEAVAGQAYRIWLRGKADGDHWGNDSVFVQFSGSITSSGSSIWRIGTTSATEINLEECSGCGISGWKWEDNGWGGRDVLGPLVYFANGGTQTIRVQTREDGLAVDQILLSPSTYISSRPGGTAPPPPSAPPSAAIVQPDGSGNLILSHTAVSRLAGRWAVESSSGALSGSVVRHPDAGAARIGTPSSSPANYFEMQFAAVAGQPYRIWLRGKADGDHWANDSVHIQFSGSVTSSGSATWRIGTTSGTTISLEECSGCGVSGWTWEDNGWGSPGTMGPVVYFATSGTQTIRVQTREDGLSVDQIVLSPSTFLSSSPGGSSSAPPPPSSEPSGSTLKVLHWNIHHGVGTDGVYDLARLADGIAQADPDVVSLNEVERYTGWGNEDQPARFAALLQSRTGRTWYYHFATRSGGSSGQGNLLLSRYRIESTGSHLLSHDRSVARIRITVNGRAVNIFSTHLDSDSSSRRSTQMNEVKAWVAGYSEQRIVAGDFNTWPSAGEIGSMTGTYYDVWAQAAADNTAVAYPGNTAGNTRNSRIDYIFLSRGASYTAIRGAQVFDLRDSSGVMPSDHRPLLGIFEVR